MVAIIAGDLLSLRDEKKRPMNHNQLHRIEVCLTPALLPHCLATNPAVVVVVDILRATTSICTAFEHGAAAIIPVAGLDEARHMKTLGYKVAAERDGVILDFADYGNSAFDFMNPGIRGETIVYSTTNGTQTIGLAAEKGTVLIGAFSNISALTGVLNTLAGDVLIVCSGWKNRFNLEDTLFAGALAQRLTSEGHFTTNDDATLAALDLWQQAANDLTGYLEKAEHRARLRRLKLDNVLTYTFTPDTCRSVPVMHGNRLTDGCRIGFPAALDNHSQNK